MRSNATMLNYSAFELVGSANIQLMPASKPSFVGSCKQSNDKMLSYPVVGLKRSTATCSIW